MHAIKKRNLLHGYVMDKFNMCTLAPDCSAERDQTGRGGTSRELASPSSRSPPLHLEA